MTLTRKEVSRFTSKLYRFLEDDHKIEFKKMRKFDGSITFYDNTPAHVLLDPRKELIPTLIHESLHYFYPEASEAWVLTMESKIVSKLSPRQVRNIIKCLGRNI